MDGWTNGGQPVCLLSPPTAGPAAARDAHRYSGGAGVAAAFGGLSASLAELLSSFSVLGKDAFTSSMHSAGRVYENISDRGRNMLVHTVRIYVVCKTYRTYVATLKIA